MDRYQIAVVVPTDAPEDLGERGGTSDATLLLHKARNMSEIALNTTAPDFELADFRGQKFRLSQLKDAKLVLLVFNRGFT